MIGTKLPNGVFAIPATGFVVDHIAEHKLSEIMSVSPGKGITEHKHENSLYFAKNAHLTLDGETFKMPSSVLVFIPEGVSHGWLHSNEEKEDAVIASFDPGHSIFETYNSNSEAEK